MGSARPKHPDMIYPVNYGYIPNIFSADGEELDVYLLGVGEPVETYTARIIAIVHRHNDVEDQLVAAPEGCHFDPAEIAAAVYFRNSTMRVKLKRNQTSPPRRRRRPWLALLLLPECKTIPATPQPNPATKEMGVKALSRSGKEGSTTATSIK